MTDAFDIRNGRVMLSLGPLNERHYCTFRCPFCYVPGGFAQYPRLSVAEICDWVTSVTSPYDVIYVSGDTDSFASPRTETGLELLMALAQFNVDLLFTTRHLFTANQLVAIGAILERQKAQAKKLFGCTSIAQLTHPELEPRPIAPPLDRVAQLARFKQMGLVAIASICPILPFIEASEYLRLIGLCSGKVDAILGADWYTDPDGIIAEKTLGDTRKLGAPDDIRRMDFNDSSQEWRVFESKQTKQLMAQKCAELSIPFFERSRPALTWLRRQTSAPTLGNR